MTFDQWWTEYPLKKGRKEAQKAWDRLTADEQAQAVLSLPEQKKEWRLHGTEKRFLPRASTWLNQARFEDEFDTEAPAKEPDWLDVAMGRDKVVDVDAVEL